MPFPPGMTYRWDHVRRAQYWFWGSFLTYLPAGALAMMLLRPWTDAEWPLGVLAGFWLLAFFVSGFRLSAVRCPRCQHAFFRQEHFATTTCSRGTACIAG